MEDLSTSVPLPRYVNTLARRIIAEDQVRKMIDLETGGRNQAILALLYGCGLRVSELCALRRRDLQSRGPTGQITVTGKGRRVRVVLLPEAVWEQLQKLSSGMDPASPVFRPAAAPPSTARAFCRSSARQRDGRPCRSG